MATSEDEQTIRELDHRWNEVYLRNDRAAFAEILADDFHAQFANGLTGGKNDLMRPTPVAAKVIFSDSESGIRVFAPTAITWGRVRIEHPDRVVDQRFVRVYSKRQGHWQAVFVFVSPVTSN